jgi:group I intron endonuclease
MGIYCIRNTINNKRYIGSSINIENRWYVHKSRLKLNKHHSDHLQKSYNIESTNFQYEILEVTLDKDQLEIREQYWIDHYLSYKSDNGYNACRTVSKIDPERMRERWAKPGEKEKQSIRMKGVCSTLEHRNKLSIGHIEHFKDPNNRFKKLQQVPHKKSVRCIETGQIFISINQAAKELGVSIVKIRDSASGKRKSNGNMSFEWINNE